MKVSSRSALPEFALCQPRRVQQVPPGPEWIHEIKFDGWRLIIRKIGGEVRLLTRSGADITARLANLARELTGLAAETAILDTELVAVDQRGACEFAALPSVIRKGPSEHLLVRAFDLLYWNGRDVTTQPLMARKALLGDLLARSTCPHLRTSPGFDDGEALLAVAADHGLGGIVSKRRDRAYRAGPACDWRKIKTATWLEAHRGRGELFRRR